MKLLESYREMRAAQDALSDLENRSRVADRSVDGSMFEPARARLQSAIMALSLQKKLTIDALAQNRDYIDKWGRVAMERARPELVVRQLDVLAYLLERDGRREFVPEPK